MRRMRAFFFRFPGGFLSPHSIIHSFCFCLVRRLALRVGDRGCDREQHEDRRVLLITTREHGGATRGCLQAVPNHDTHERRLRQEVSGWDYYDKCTSSYFLLLSSLLFDFNCYNHYWLVSSLSTKR